MVTSRPRSFADVIPYATPESLDDLHGPRSGTVPVPIRINTAPDATYDLDRESSRWAMYSAVVRDGTATDQAELLDAEFLVELWPDLNLPKRCRAAWTDRFPELRALPVRALAL